MLCAICLGIALLGAPPTPAGEAKLARLSAARGWFEKRYVPSRNANLQIVENLGTNNLGNPYRQWYYPAGSADCRIWIVTYQGYQTTDSRGRAITYRDTGALVHQTWHGRHTTTDWALDLVASKSKSRPAGTVARMVADAGFMIKGTVTQAQARLLTDARAYVGFTIGRGPFDGHIYTWFIAAGGEDSAFWFHCDPTESKGDAEYTDDRRVLYAPPIVPEEARFMGIKRRKLWHGRGKFTVERIPLGNVWSGLR